ncbi:hypothetical protein PCL_08570 [Purpureocillium lilacinum]|uniref:Uncharacterized protein n=1 Tax=Purpureocillium lilacinum TaxID=33203 RepID=A0A2U3DRC0_PURLI|nr:hypothetical protein PCL_08570 [Purpureocillium lilacinum]
MVAHPPSPRDMLCLIASNLCACFLFLDPAGRQPGTNRARHYEREQIITAANDQKTWGPGISAGTIASRDSPPPRSPLPPPPPRREGVELAGAHHRPVMALLRAVLGTAQHTAHPPFIAPPLRPHNGVVSHLRNSTPTTPRSSHPQLPSPHLSNRSPRIVPFRPGVTKLAQERGRSPRIIPTSDGLPRTGREPRGKFFPSPSPAEAADDFPRRCFCTPSPVPRLSMLMLNERLRLDHGKEDGRSSISPGLSVRPTAVRAHSRHQLPVSNGVVLRPSNFVPGSFSAWALRLRLRAKETSDGSGRSRPGTGVARLQCGQPRISTPSRQEQLPSAARMTMCASLFAHLVRRWCDRGGVPAPDQSQRPRFAARLQAIEYSSQWCQGLPRTMRPLDASGSWLPHTRGGGPRRFPPRVVQEAEMRGQLFGSGMAHMPMLRAPDSRAPDNFEHCNFGVQVDYPETEWRLSGGFGSSSQESRLMLVCAVKLPPWNPRGATLSNLAAASQALAILAFVNVEWYIALAFGAARRQRPWPVACLHVLIKPPTRRGTR